MAEEHSLERFKKMLFDDTATENTQNPDSFECQQSHFFNDSRFENINNQIISDENYVQSKREGEYSSFIINKNGEICDIQQSASNMKTRARTSPRQLEILESVCRNTLKPNKEMRIRLARELNMTERQVQIWFQNKRAKSKKIAERNGMYDNRYETNRYNNDRYDIPSFPPNRYECGYSYINPYEVDGRYAINTDYSYPGNPQSYENKYYGRENVIERIDYANGFYDPRPYTTDYQDPLYNHTIPKGGYCYDYNNPNNINKRLDDVFSKQHEDEGNANNLDDREQQCPNEFFFTNNGNFYDSNN